MAKGLILISINNDRVNSNIIYGIYSSFKTLKDAVDDLIKYDPTSIIIYECFDMDNKNFSWDFCYIPKNVNKDNLNAEYPSEDKFGLNLIIDKA